MSGDRSPLIVVETAVNNEDESGVGVPVGSPRLVTRGGVEQ
jgi:hypothetical protein